MEQDQHERKPWDTPEEAATPEVKEWAAIEIYSDDGFPLTYDDEIIVASDWDSTVKDEKAESAARILELTHENKNLLHRLNKRLRVIADMKSAYLRDIIAMKTIMANVLTANERASVMDEWKKAVPSFDMTQALSLFAPSNASLQTKPCDLCGGRLEVQFEDLNATANLRKEIQSLKARNERISIDMLKWQTMYQNIESTKDIASSKHEIEV